VNKIIIHFSLVIFAGAFLISASGFEAEVPSVSIGTQTWCKSNLEVTMYRNGDVIPEVQDQKAWAALTTGAWCYYENKSANGITYGKLYNWYAVNDPRGLAPVGYHIPNKAEWKLLGDTLGGKEIAGKMIKAPSGWKKKGNGTNSSGFSALPGGCRNSDGFEHMKEGAYWWSTSFTTYRDVESVNYSYVFYAFDWISHDVTSKGRGFSVRCIKD